MSTNCHAFMKFRVLLKLSKNVSGFEKGWDEKVVKWVIDADPWDQLINLCF